MTAAAPTIVQEAESLIYRRLRVTQMLSNTLGTMTPGNTNDTIPLPSNYLEDKSFFLTGTSFCQLKRKTMQEVMQNYCYDGSGNRVQTQPYMYFNDGTAFHLDSPADQPYPWLLYFYQQPIPLSATNTQNFITQTYPRLMRAACTAQASEFMKDAGMGNYDRMYWVQMTEEEIEKAQQESDRSEHTLDVGMRLT